MSSLIPAFVGALQGTVAVLLTIVAGNYISRIGYLDAHTINKISKMCSHIFLPCLIFTAMGPGLTLPQLQSLWIIPVWGFFSSCFSHGLGFVARSLFDLPAWSILAAGRANSAALPLLLLQSLESVGILDILKAPGETSEETLLRAKGLVLLNTIVQEVFTFGIGAWVLNMDVEAEKVPDRNPTSSSLDRMESAGLLHDAENAVYGSIPQTLTKPTTSRSLSAVVSSVRSSFNPITTTALITIIFGLTPPLHDAFLVEDGFFYPSITQPMYNVGQLFVVIQMLVVGAQLHLVQRANPGVKPTSYCLVMRYFLMPAVAFAFVYFTARKGIYEDDPLLWFILMMIPCGPSAMLLISIAENVGVSQGPIAGYLTVSYIFAPFIAVCCAIALGIVSIL